jgi:hypothetical protein
MIEQFMKDDDSLVVPQIKPNSLVIDRDREIHEERKWVVLTSNEQWKFPDNLSVAEAGWAGWLNRSQNTICIQELDWPIKEPPYHEFILQSHRQEWLNKSLFTAVSKADYPTLLEPLHEEEHPTWLSDYGPGGLLVGWLHPSYLHERYEGDIVIRYDQDQDRHQVFVPHDLEEAEFTNLLDKLKENLGHQNLIPLSSETAILVAAASGDPLLPEIGFIEVGSAQLFHDFEDVPSPVYLNKRRLIFVRMWKIPTSPQEAIEILSAHPLDLGNEAQIYWDAKRGPISKQTFLMSSLIFLCPADMSCDNFFESIEVKRQKLLAEIAQHIHASWSEAELCTVEFWRTEVGFKIDDNKFEGNPWVMFLPKENKE